MANRTGKCINFGLCTKADRREIIPVAGGVDFSCPECGKPLTDSAGAATAGKTTTNTGAGKKAIVIGALGLALITGTAYKYLTADHKNEANPAKDPSISAQEVSVSKDASAPPVLPPEDGSVTPPRNGNVIPPSTGPLVSHKPVSPPTAEEDQPPAATSSSGTMVARLLSAINTRTASEGDTFTARLENGPYRGKILSGYIKKLKRGKKNCEMELAFNKLSGKPIPVPLDLVDIANAQGVKGIDDENNKIAGRSSKKKKVALTTAAGGVIGSVIGAIKGGKEESAAGPGAGSGAGFALSMTVMSRAQDVDLQPGSRLTLRSSSR